MRIAILFDCLYPWTKGGVERVFRGYAEEWVAEGHEVTYLTRRQWPENAEPDVPGVRVESIAGPAQLYDDAGTRRLGPAFAFSWAILRALVRRRGAFDAVYVAATPAINVPAARLALLGSPARLLVEWVEIWRLQQWREYSGPLVGRLAWAAQALSIALSRRVVVNSRLHAGRLRQQRYRGRLFVTPGLLPSAEFGAAPRLTAPERPRLLYVGRHIPDKRVELVPAVVAELRRAGREVTAVVTGDGPTRVEVLARARELGVEDVCTFPGFVPQVELDELLATSSCLVHPSVREGYGLVVVEAASAGTPSVVAAAEDNAAAELVTDGVNGFVAQAAEAAPLARAVAAAIDGGAPLRRTTRQWFEETARHGTVQASARALLQALLD